MPLTPDSASAPYLSVADFLALRDYREVGPLATDDTTSPLPTPAQLATNAYVLTALSVASGELEAAVLRGDRYAVADLQALSGNSAAYLKSVVAAVAFQRLRERRGADVEPLPDYTQALQFLGDLSDGQAVLAFAETQAAGLPMTSHLTLRDRRAIGLVSTITRAFGHRGGRVDDFPS